MIEKQHLERAKKINRFLENISNKSPDERSCAMVEKNDSKHDTMTEKEETMNDTPDKNKTKSIKQLRTKKDLLFIASKI